jgi:hypothetical protein
MYIIASVERDEVIISFMHTQVHGKISSDDDDDAVAALVTVCADYTLHLLLRNYEIITGCMYISMRRTFFTIVCVCV